MAQRKDQMRIIRQDAGFSAKLGFGAPVIGRPVDRRSPTDTADPATSESAPANSGGLTTGPAEAVFAADDATVSQSTSEESKSREEEGASSRDEDLSKSRDLVAKTSSSGSRGQVVYVAVSLTARQAVLAEAWAEAARCSIQFLIRRVAQGLREDIFEDWERNGMPEVTEPRGGRGKHPTSVTLTLQPQFAAGLSAKHDPLGIMGLARVIGPTFRARFQVAFDAALIKANIGAVSQGDNK